MHNPTSSAQAAPRRASLPLRGSPATWCFEISHKTSLFTMTSKVDKLTRSVSVEREAFLVGAQE